MTETSTEIANAPTAPSTTPRVSAHRGELDAAHERERALVERAKQGDQRAFRQLYDLHARSVFRYGIMPMVRDRHLAEDLLADTFVRAMENLQRFHWQGKGLLPWLIRIGKNLCLDHLRKAGRMSSWPEGFEQQIPDLAAPDAEEVVGQLELSEILSVRIEACMEAINPRYQRVLRLRLIDKVPRADAAASMDVTIGTLDVLLFRACKAFRKVYLQRYESEPQ